MSNLSAGVWGVLATPFHGDQLDVDAASLLRAVDHYEKLGAAGVVALGVFGEAASLTTAERAQVTRTVAEATSDCAVVVGLTSTDTDLTIEEARQVVSAAPSRISALMVQVNSGSSAELRAHLHAVHAACDLPFVLQDYPVASGVHASAEVIADAANLDFVLAVKCESPPTSSAIGALATLTDVPLFGGLGGIGLLDELQSGAAGAMTGFSYPEALHQVTTAWTTGGFDAARNAIAPWLPLINFEAQLGVGLAIRKELLRRRGILRDARVRPPRTPLPTALLDHVDAHLRSIAKIVS